MDGTAKGLFAQRVSARDLDGKLAAGETETVEVADDRRSEAVGLEEFARDLLDFRRRDAFQHGDQLLRRKMAVEVDVIAREAVHARAGTFQREQSGALEMIFGAAKLFVVEQFFFQAAEFGENALDQLPGGFKRSAGVHGKHAGVAIGVHFAENRVSQPEPLANVLK